MSFVIYNTWMLPLEVVTVLLSVLPPGLEYDFHTYDTAGCIWNVGDIPYRFYHINPVIIYTWKLLIEIISWIVGDISYGLSISIQQLFIPGSY